MSAKGDHTDFLAFTRRILRAYGRRVADADPEDLAELLSVQRDVGAAIDAAVLGMRANGFTWAQIGEGAGITRQAAQIRWGVKAPLTVDAAPEGEAVQARSALLQAVTAERWGITSRLS